MYVGCGCLVRVAACFIAPIGAPLSVFCLRGADCWCIVVTVCVVVGVGLLAALRAAVGQGWYVSVGAGLGSWYGLAVIIAIIAIVAHYNTHGPGNARYFSLEKQPLPPPGRRRRAALYAASGIPAGRLGAEGEEQAFSLAKRQRRSGRETWSSESEGDSAEEELRERRARAAQRTRDAVC